MPRDDADDGAVAPSFFGATRGAGKPASASAHASWVFVSFRRDPETVLHWRAVIERMAIGNCLVPSAKQAMSAVRYIAFVDLAAPAGGERARQAVDRGAGVDWQARNPDDACAGPFVCNGLAWLGGQVAGQAALAAMPHDMWARMSGMTAPAWSIPSDVGYMRDLSGRPGLQAADIAGETTRPVLWFCPGTDGATRAGELIRLVVISTIALNICCHSF